MCRACGCCPQRFIFYKNLFHQKQFHYAIHIGIAQIRSDFLKIFLEKMRFFTSARCCFQFLKEITLKYRIIYMNPYIYEDH